MKIQIEGSPDSPNDVYEEGCGQTSSVRSYSVTENPSDTDRMPNELRKFTAKGTLSDISFSSNFLFYFAYFSGFQSPLHAETIWRTNPDFWQFGVRHPKIASIVEKADNYHKGRNDSTLVAWTDEGEGAAEEHGTICPYAFYCYFNFNCHYFKIFLKSDFKNISRTL